MNGLTWCFASSVFLIIDIFAFSFSFLPIKSVCDDPDIITITASQPFLSFVLLYVRYYDYQLKCLLFRLVLGV